MDGPSGGCQCLSPVPGPGVEVVQDPGWDNHTIIISFSNVLFLRKKRRENQARLFGLDSACNGEEPKASRQEVTS